MNDPALIVDRLEKVYRLGSAQARPDTAYGALKALAAGPLRRLRYLRSLTRFAGREEEGEDTVWALGGVSFEVARGEVVGIIGRNGAGKSTLLKVLSRITEPSGGQVDLYGNVSSLLEVGTGFHPELSGRENIYLNGAILGMSRGEIARKFDEIVAFAEVEKFIDTPVKRYSSGMYVRLAFAVAAHLEPDILVVDEVLAVGDASFQRKCLDKMEDVGESGRTVLFVSHNMASITRLCPRAILLEEGRVVRDGPSHEVAGAYLSSGLGVRGERRWEEAEAAPGNAVTRLRAARVVNPSGEPTDVADIREEVGVQIEFDVLQPGHVLCPNFHVFNEDGICAFVLNDTDPAWHRRERPPGRHTATAWIPGNFLAEGTLVVGLAVSTLDPVVVHFYERDALAFQVVDTLDGDSARGDFAGPFPGVVRPMVRWESGENVSESESERGREGD